MGYTKHRTSFTLRHVSTEHISELLELENQLRVHPSREHRGKFNAAFWLEEGQDYSWLLGFLERHNLSPANYGFTVSVVTEEESGSVDLPGWVTPLLQQVRGGIRFSYTFLDPEAAEAETDLEPPSGATTGT